MRLARGQGDIAGDTFERGSEVDSQNRRLKHFSHSYTVLQPCVLKHGCSNIMLGHYS